jgi:hypothetical protein
VQLRRDPPPTRPAVAGRTLESANEPRDQVALRERVLPTRHGLRDNLAVVQLGAHVGTEHEQIIDGGLRNRGHVRIAEAGDNDPQRGSRKPFVRRRC